MLVISPFRPKDGKTGGTDVLAWAPSVSELVSGLSLGDAVLAGSPSVGEVGGPAGSTGLPKDYRKKMPP